MLCGFDGVYFQLNHINHCHGYTDYLPSDIARFEQATPQSLQKFAQQYLGKNQRAIVYGVPGDKHIEDVPAVAEKEVAMEATPDREPWRAQAPASGPPSTLHLPAPNVFKLANG